MGGGGFRGGGFGGGGFRGGGFGGGGFRGGFGGFNRGGFNRGFGHFNNFNRFGFRNLRFRNSFGFPFFNSFGAGFGFGGFGGFPYDDFGYYPSSFDYGYGYPAAYSGVAAYPAAQPASPNNVVVVYPPQQSAVFADRAAPVIREYDEYGQEVQPRAYSTVPQSAPPPSDTPQVYLIAFQKGDIRAAVAYWVDGDTLHYVGTDHLERQSPLSLVDRDLSARLNRERHVTFTLPAPK
jgi:hypothetical protein